MEEETKTSSLAILASPSPNIPLEESLVTNEAFSNTALIEIFKFLSFEDLLNCSKVCPLWKQIAFQHFLWRNFTFYSCHQHVQQLFEQEYGPYIKNLHLLKVDRETRLLNMVNVKQLFISASQLNALQIISERNKEIKEFHIDTLFLRHHEFELIGNIKNLTHVNICILITDPDRYKSISDVGLRKLTKLQHLGINAICDESVWENIVKMSTIKSLQITYSLFEDFELDEGEPEPSWIDALFGPKFLIKNMQSLKKLEIQNMPYIHEYDVLKNIKLLVNLKELVLDEVSVSKYGESNFGSLLGQCQNLERLTLSLNIPRDEIDLSEDIEDVLEDIEEASYVSALENSEIVKGVLSLNKTLKYFRWFLACHEALDLVPIYSKTGQNVIPFHSFRVFTTNQVRTYVDKTGPGYITVSKLSDIFKMMLPDTEVEMWTSEEKGNIDKHKRCYECFRPMAIM